jgi:hypothetical protein
MIRPTATAVTPFVRRLVLGTAFLVGLVFALAPRTPAVQAQETRPAPAAESKQPPASKTITISNDPGVGPKIEIKESPDAAADAAAKAAGSADAAGTPPAADKPATGGHRAGKGRRVVVSGVGADREFDSFDEFVHNEPAIATGVVAIVAVVFLSPVLAIALILWYRFRKARMLNETMVKLAEKGVVAPAEAIGALTSGTVPAAAMSAAAPIYEQAKAMRARAAWSDLRKGVIMGAIGLGLTFYSMLDDGTPNGIGLILLFVGIGYVALWWFEDRQPRPGTGGGAAGGA